MLKTHNLTSINPFQSPVSEITARREVHSQKLIQAHPAQNPSVKLLKVLK